jgi:HK97 family phage prohead protease
MERTVFTFPVEQVEFADSGAGDGQMTVRGHAAVYNKKSHDLGGFRTMIAPGAFSKVLDSNPDVHLVWDHDTRYVLARTTNKTLELRDDPMGLHTWARMAGTSYAKDLALLMQRGDVDQMSFACTIGADEWTENDSGVTRTIFSVDELFDVTICAQGAFPQTDSQIVKANRAAFDNAVKLGRVSGRAIQEPAAESPDGSTVAPSEGSRDKALELTQLKARARVAITTHSRSKTNGKDPGGTSGRR